MEASQSENDTHDSHRYGRKDSGMATSSIEERLRRLEDAHSIHGPAHVSSPLVCNASLQHTQQISELGEGFNNLDEALHALEQANNDREERVRKLEQQTCVPQSIEVDRKDVSKMKDGTEEPVNAKTDSAVSKLLVDLEVQKATLNHIAIRLGQLEKQSASSLSAFATHNIAQTLVQRLGDGEDLGPLVNLQLRATLGMRASLLPTPAPTSTTRGESTTSAATFDESRSEAAPGRPPKRRLDEPADDEPMLKRQRGSISKSASSDSLSVKSEPKRGRGRPPTHGRYARKSSLESTASSSSGAAPPATMPAPRSLSARTSIKKKGTATKLTKPMLKKRIADEEPTPKVGKHWRDRIISGSTNSDASMEQSAVITPKRTIHETGVTSAAGGDAKSDEPIAVATKAHRSTKSQSNKLTPGCSEATTSHKSANQQPSMVTPQRKNIKPLPNDSTPQAQSRVRGFDSESPSEIKGRSSPGYRDMHIHDLAALEGSTTEALSIPPERRSSRKPKAARHFGDMVSWKEANVTVGALRPSAP